MAGGSVSELVIFIAAVSVAAGVSGAMVTSVGGIADAVDQQGADVARQIDTDVAVISDPGSGAVYDAGAEEVRVLVKNTGRRTLAADGVEVLVDGRYVPASATAVAVVEGEEFRPGAVARVTVNRTLAPGDHRVTVVAGSERETLRFRT